MDQINFKHEIEARGFKTITEFTKALSQLKERLDPKFEEKADTERFNLLGKPDSELTPEQIKMKRIQNMQFKAHQIREERKKEKEQAQKRKEEMMSSEESKKAYLIDLYEKRKELILNQEQRKKLKEEQAKRGNVIAQRRMQMMAELELEGSELPSNKRQKTE